MGIRKLSRYLANTAWLLFDQILVLIITFAITAIVARYLGPELFGILSFAFALGALFGVVGKVGLEGIAVRELSIEGADQGSVLGTVFLIKGTGSFVAACVLVMYAFLAVEDALERNIIFVAALFVLSSPLSVMNYWFQANVLGKYSAISNTTGYLVSGLIRLLFVWGAFGAVYFAVANLIQALTTAFLVWAFYTYKRAPSLLSWKPSWQVAKRLLSESASVFLGGIFGVIYLKVDQVMLRWLSNPEELGIYAVAVKISEATYFLPGAIMASFFPLLVQLKKTDEAAYNSYLRAACDTVAMLSMAIIIGVVLFGQLFINLAFGPEFRGSSLILLIHILATPFIFLRTVFSRWILIEGMASFLVISQGLGALLNVVLNFALIPHFEGVGAAVATVLAYAVASYFALLLHPRARPLFFIMTRSILSPWRGVSGIRMLSRS
tara:strand:+ start:6287 stop:7600 length:1314 start_codon:yes stop_codon:yes gene_type:complete